MPTAPLPTHPAGLVALGAAPLDGGKTPAAHLALRRPGLPQSDDAVARRGTRMAAAAGVDERLLHSDPEAAARHIRALKKAQAEAEAAARLGLQSDALPHLQQQQQQQQRQQQQQEDGAEEARQDGSGEAAAVAAAAAGALQDRDVLTESTKENLPEAAAAAAATPQADVGAPGGSGKLSGKGTLTAVVAQHASSRLRREGSGAVLGSAAGLLQEAEAGGADAGDAMQVEQQQQQDEAQQQRQQAEALPQPPKYEPLPADYARAERLQTALAQRTEGLVLDHLESVHAKLARWGAVGTGWGGG